MAGHSKWANIKRTKAKVDAARGATFTKVARELIIASKLGGPDPDGNYRLRTAITKAKAAGMPADNIKRAIAKGQGSGEGDNVEEIQYEGYGPGGVAVIVQAMTDNRNRTASDVRHFFSKYGGNLGETGCVGWMFQPKGLIRVTGDALDFDAVMLAAAEAGADDVRDNDGGIEVVTAPEDLQAVHEALSAAGCEIESAELTQLPSNTVELTDADHAKRLLRLLDALEEHDDVQEVYCNVDLADDLAEAVSA